MPFGYHGKILHVDLTHSRLEVEQPDEGFYRQYMGGSALAMYYLLKHTPPNTPALDPKNTLVLALSVLTGVPVSGQSRLTAAARSPLTNAVGDFAIRRLLPGGIKVRRFRCCYPARAFRAPGISVGP